MRLIGQEPPLPRLSLKRRPRQLAKSDIESSPWWGTQGVCQDRRGGSEQRLGDWDPGSQQRSGTEQGTMQKNLEANGDSAGLGVSQQRGKFRATKA